MWFDGFECYFGCWLLLECVGDDVVCIEVGVVFYVCCWCMLFVVV